MLLVEKMLMSGGAPTDTYFENVILLLHGDGTNGGQNNTFIDSSNNNFTMTRTGNTTQGSFNPYGNLWSNYFDGTDDYLSVADNAALRPGAGAFTIEAWIYRNALGADHTIFAKGGASTGVVFQVTSGNILRFTHTTTNIDSTGTISAGTWTHVAVVREGTGTNQTKLYINGTNDGQGTISTDFTQTEEVRIGTDRSAAADFSGYISNLRLVKGTAVYTGNFAPPASPLTAISNTSLLTCQSNRFLDNSSNSFTVVRNGGTLVSTFTPYNPSVVYTSVAGGSAYIDGSGDTIDSPATTTFNYGTGDFTYETWVYPESTPNDSTIISQPSAGTPYPLFMIYNGALHWSPSGGSYQAFGLSVTNGQWNHIAVVRQGGTMYGFLNGVRGSTTHAYATSLGDGRFIRIAVGNRYKGYLSDTRISNIAVYTTTTYTVPTSKVAATSSTNLLLNYTNAAIFDSAAKNVVETNGNAQIDTGTKKFGTGSLEFDGNGDFLTLPGNNIFALTSTSPFTIEFWSYPTASAGTIFCDEYDGNIVAIAVQLVSTSIGIDSTGLRVGLGYFTAATGWILTRATEDLQLNVWQHVACVFTGSTSKIYYNGVDKTATDPAPITSWVPVNDPGSKWFIGKRWDPGPSTVITGYLDDFRFTKGVARYTANFTPPTRAFPDK
jgi:hypothetical protein